uniref:Uncharacterized protein n=1 Tax=Arundo donax TaxID=35708 RepID=A0A0A9G2S9_ARUDO
MFLQNHNFTIEPELVNGQIAVTACCVCHCFEINKELLQCLRKTSYLEKEGIDTQGWDAVKYATAMAIMCTNEPLPGPYQVFSEEELEKINGKGKYDKKLFKNNFMVIYEKAVRVHHAKVEKHKELEILVKEAKERSDKPEGIGNKRKRSCLEAEADEGDIAMGQVVVDADGMRKYEADDYADVHNGARNERVEKDT